MNSSSRIAVRLVALVVWWTGCGGVTPLPGEQVDAGREDGGPVDGAQVDRPEVERRTRGAACEQGAECESGFCADGVCCRTDCRGGCVSCNQAGRVGVCWPSDLGKPDPRGLCTRQDPSSCGTTGTCDGFGGCTRYEPGAVCGPSKCVDGAFQEARVCDGRGTCAPAPVPRTCAPYTCQAAGCPSACLSDAACVAPAVCLRGACRPLPSVLLTGAGATPEIGGFYLAPPVEDACPAGAAVVGFEVTATSDASAYVGRIRTVCGALVVTHASSVAIGVGATTPLAERGTGTGTTISLRCPKNQVVVGYDGRSGSWVDQLSFRCSPLLVTNGETAVVLGAVTKIGPAGGDGGSPHGETDCGPGQVSVGSRSLADSVVNTFALSCATVSLRGTPSSPMLSNKDARSVAAEVP